MLLFRSEKDIYKIFRKVNRSLNTEVFLVEKLNETQYIRGLRLERESIVSFEETNHYCVMKQFFDNKDRLLHHLLNQ